MNAGKLVPHIAAVISAPTDAQSFQGKLGPETDYPALLEARRIIPLCRRGGNGSGKPLLPNLSHATLRRTSLALRGLSQIVSVSIDCLPRADFRPRRASRHILCEHSAQSLKAEGLPELYSSAHTFRKTNRVFHLWRNITFPLYVAGADHLNNNRLYARSI